MAKFQIPEVVFPTDEELFDVCSAKYARVAHTYIDHWPADLLALSFPTTLVPVETGLMRDLFGDAGERAPAAAAIVQQLDDAMGWRQWFVRLNSRSPKDSAYPGLPVTCSGKQAVWWLGSSERVLDDTSLMHHARKPLYVCLREWHHMEKDGEFRCFAKDGELKAVSRYFYDEAPTSALQPDEHVWDAAQSFYELHLEGRYPDIVFDLYLPFHGEERLIEINPYGLSDPCLFGNYEAIETIGGVRQAR